MMHAADEWRPDAPFVEDLHCSAAVAAGPFRSSGEGAAARTDQQITENRRNIFASSAKAPSGFSHADVSDRAQSRRCPHTGRSVSTLQAAASCVVWQVESKHWPVVAVQCR
jgi:hypothetical protein